MNKLDAVLDKYYEKYGKNYPLCITENKSADEIIADIELCIDTGQEAEEPSYDEEADY